MRSRNCKLRVVESVTDLNGTPKTESPYPQLRWLDSVYVSVVRHGKRCTRCFTDLTNEEQDSFLRSMNFEEVKELCLLMAGAVRGIGDIYGLSFVGIDEDIDAVKTESHATRENN